MQHSWSDTRWKYGAWSWFWYRRSGSFEIHHDFPSEIHYIKMIYDLSHFRWENLLILFLFLWYLKFRGCSKLMRWPDLFCIMLGQVCCRTCKGFRFDAWSLSGWFADQADICTRCWLDRWDCTDSIKMGKAENAATQRQTAGQCIIVAVNQGRSGALNHRSRSSRTGAPLCKVEQ